MHSNNDPKIAVIGSSSMIGSRFCELASNLHLIKADLSGQVSVDLTKPETINNFFSKFEFDILILFSAFTDVDAAEKQRNDKNGIAWRINAEGTKEIIKLCKKNAKKLIFISTDFVFDGTKGPYSEDDQVAKNLNKVSWYAITKIEGENNIKNELSDYIIIRIGYPYRSRFSKKEDFAKQIIKKYDSQTLYPMFSDQIFTPTFIDDLAPAVSLLLEKKQLGIFHLASPELTTPFEFTKTLLNIFNRDSKLLQEGSLSDFLRNNPDAAPRPIKGGLKTGKIESIGFKPTNYIKGIRQIYEQSEGKLI